MSIPRILALSLLLGVVLAAGLAMVLPYDVTADVDFARAGASPSLSHPLGTDHMGRDVAMRLMFACRAFVGPGLLAALVAAAAGVTIGSLAGFLGGGAAGLLRYPSAVLASIPRFVLVLLVMSIYGDHPWVLGLAVGLAYTPAMAEAVHSRVESMRSADFVLAARAHGLSPLRVLLYHLLWVNCRHLVGRHLLILFGYLLLIETTLSYIGGFGVREPDPSWGNMLAFDFGHQTGNPWGTWAPALAIWLTILATTLLGEALGEQADA